MRSFLDRVEATPGSGWWRCHTVLAIKSLVADIHGRGSDINDDLAVSHNTGVTHVVLTTDGPWVADWSVAPT
jgi:hypothetical protein